MVADILVAIAGHGLKPSLQRLIEKPLGPKDWNSLLTWLEKCKLSTFAAAASEAGTLPVTGEQSEDLRQATARASGRCDSARESLEEIVTALDSQSVDSCVLHDAATSVLDYPSSPRRLFDSIDILVAPADHQDALTHLAEEGLLHVAAVPARSRRRREATHAAANGVAVGIHTALTPGRFGRPIEARDPFARRLRFCLNGVPMSAPGNEERLIMSCIHARLQRTECHLLAQRDVVQLVLRDDLSLREVERLASSWRVEAVLADAVRRAWETFSVADVVPISAWSSSYRPHRRDRRKLAAHPVPSNPHAGSPPTGKLAGVSMQSRGS